MISTTTHRIYSWRNIFLLFASIMIFASSANAQILPPILKCASVNSNGSDIDISWELPVNFCGPFMAYYIYGDTNVNGSYTMLQGTITNPSQKTYKHVGAAGISTTWHYYMESDYICAGLIPWSSDTIDSDPPMPPEIDYVTVLQNNDVVLDWTSLFNPETYSYIVYYDKDANNIFFPIATVIGNTNSTYTDTNAIPEMRSETYRVATLDSCGNAGTMCDLPHHTIYLEAELDRCAQHIELNWNFYENWNGGVVNYNLYTQVNNGPFTLETTLAATDDNFFFTNFNDGDSICFYMQATHQNGSVTSESNLTCLRVRVVRPPALTYIYKVDVVGSAEIGIDWIVNTDNINDLDYFKILRGTDGIKYDTIETIKAPLDPFALMSYTDYDVNPGRESYFYLVMSIDVCGAEHPSNGARTIFLSVDQGINYDNTLIWNEYFEWLGSVEGYAVYRQNDAGDWEDILFLKPPATMAKDNVTNIPDLDGKFCYKIVAEESVNSVLIPRNILGVTSTSNIICATQYPNIYVPNAFSPKGVNKIFKPVTLFVNQANYSMVIYNRWGKQIFQSQDITVGWDGKFNGMLAPQGVYLYDIKFINPDGNSYRKTGSVFLMRVQ